MTPRHSRPRISRRQTTWAFGAVAAGTMVLAPSIASADPTPSIEQVQGQLDKLYQQAANANEAYNAAQVAQQQLQAQINQINSEMTQEQQAIKDTQSRLGSVAAEQYRDGGVLSDPTLQLLMQSDPGTALQNAGTLDLAQQTNADAIRSYAQAKAVLATQAKEAATKMGLLDKSVQDAAAQKKTFDTDVAQAKALLNSLQDAQRKQLAALQAQQQAAALHAAEAASGSTGGSSSGGSSSGGSSSSSIAIPSVSGRAAAAVAFARAQIGKPYVFGATGPGAYDCSGLTQAAWRAAGVSIPRTATAQMQGLKAVPASAAQPGDLVFFYGNSSYVNHVGMYIGGGMVIHAPEPVNHGLHRPGELHAGGRVRPSIALVGPSGATNAPEWPRGCYSRVHRRLGEGRWPREEVASARSGCHRRSAGLPAGPVRQVGAGPLDRGDRPGPLCLSEVRSGLPGGSSRGTVRPGVGSPGRTSNAGPWRNW